jgi:hypothetical protein
MPRLPSVPPRSGFTAQFPSEVRNVLVVANGLQAVAALAATLRELVASEGVRVHVLSVQQRPTGYAMSHLRGIDVEAVQRADGEQALAPLCAALDARGVQHTRHVEIGAWLETIARFAADRCCRRIFVGDNRRNPFKDALLRHDCARIRQAVAALGFECLVLRREPGPASAGGLGRSPA